MPVRLVAVSFDAHDPASCIARAARPFRELMPEAHAQDIVRGLCLAHMDAHLKRSIGACAFLSGDLAAAFNARGIALEAPTPQPV